MAKVILACVLSLLLATAVFGADFLCGLKEEELGKILDCVQKNVKPEPDYLEEWKKASGTCGVKWLPSRCGVLRNDQADEAARYAHDGVRCGAIPLSIETVYEESTMKAALFFASALLMATVANAGQFLCRLPDDKVLPALECLQQNVNPEIAGYLGRLPEKGAGFVRNACKSGQNFEEIMRYVWTEDYLAEISNADKICEAKF
ncbi:hypothetical protein HPB50_020017 [Hyalomma asiaticum]|uniref:Uncharacterized protein n=1 Tax=Hyalomma asiaticum TaxID=266040 RepID=A0ACB7TKR4_HYAAI|nr:hypothetical protein HPB50_020017 [Hyalomma asiaticum]